MKKIFSTLAIAGLGAGLAVGANAQTVTSTQSGLYSFTITEGTGFGTQVTPGVYTYDYIVSLDAIAPGLSVDTFSIGNIQGETGTASAADLSGTTDFATITPQQSNIAGIANFSAATSGFSTPGLDQAEFTVFSTLPPTATVTFATTATGTVSGNVSGTGSDIGPGPATTAVPEAGSFALLGLGLLPLAFLARRRMSNNA